MRLSPRRSLLSLDRDAGAATAAGFAAETELEVDQDAEEYVDPMPILTGKPMCDACQWAVYMLNNRGSCDLSSIQGGCRMQPSASQSVRNHLTSTRSAW